MGDSTVCVHGAQEGGSRAASEAAAAEIGLCCPVQWKNSLTVTAALSADIMESDRKIQGRKLLDVHCLHVCAGLSASLHPAHVSLCSVHPSFALRLIRSHFTVNHPQLILH